jgi:hemerythrin-like domain-containing protein
MKITDAFLGEHAVFYAQFTECEDILDRADLESLRHMAAVLASALDTHAQLEDKLLFGPLASRLNDELGIFQLMEQEHTQIAQLLGQISTAHTPGRAGELMSEMIAAARAHFEKEEQVAFPRAEQILGEDELRRLGRIWSDARGVAVEVPAD